MVQETISEEVKRLITSGSVNENAIAFVRLTRDWLENLRSLQADDQGSLTRAMFVAKEAASAFQIIQVFCGMRG